VPTFRFELLNGPAVAVGPSSSYDMGYISITGLRGRINSKLSKPPRSMMIYLSIVDLLDGLRRLLSDPDQNSYTFIGTDGSFSALFEKVGSDLRISANGLVLDECRPASLAIAVIEGVDLFLGSAQLPDEPALSDLTSAISDFRSMLSTIKEAG
jgi:hypothetical protein